MLLEICSRSEPLSNSSDTSEENLDNFEFHICEGLQEGSYIWAACTVLCFALGFPACVATLLEVFKIYRRRSPITPNDFFILNLSIMDVIFLAFIPPGLLNHFFSKNLAFELFWNTIYALNTCGRPLLMACVCLDCYLAVVHPVTYRNTKSLTPRVVMASIVWTLTVATGIGYSLCYKLYYSMFSTVPFVLSMVIIGICDSFILCKLIKSNPGRKSIHPQKQRALQTLINSLIVVVVCYFPPVLLFAIATPLISSLKMFICTVGTPITLSSTLGSAVMPLLYLNNLGKLGRFRVGCCRKS